MYGYVRVHYPSGSSSCLPPLPFHGQLRKCQTIMVGNPTNTRICGSKVKTRCVTCKVRHLKCDEEKPECLRCVSISRKCARQPFKAAVKRSAKELVMINYTSNFPSAISSAVSRNSKEQRYSDYFRTGTAPDLLSCFNSELWSLYVLQLAHNKPAVRHSIIAIGYLHEQFEAASGAYVAADSDFALK